MDEATRLKWAAVDDGYPRGARFVPLIGTYVVFDPKSPTSEGPLPQLQKAWYGRIVAVHEPWYGWHQNVEVDFQFGGTASGVYAVSSTNLESVQHHPVYDWVDDDEYGAMLLGIYCPLEREEWPCAGKREHISETEATRIVRWRERRIAKDRESHFA